MRLEDRPFWRPMGQRKLPCDGERLHLSRDGTSDQILVRKGAKRIKFSWCPVTSWRLILERSRSVQSGHWLDGNQGDVGSCFPEIGGRHDSRPRRLPIAEKKVWMLCSLIWRSHLSFAVRLFWTFWRAVNFWREKLWMKRNWGKGIVHMHRGWKRFQHLAKCFLSYTAYK